MVLQNLQNPTILPVMQLQLDDVALFARITELGTLSAAARERNVPVSQVTRALARLEADCGVRLLHRTTHGLSLTDEGDTFLAHARRLLDTRDELASELSGKLAGPGGWVRLSVSPLVAQAVIVPSLNGLYQRHPQLQVDISADDRIADMAREGIDIAIRTGSPSSDTLVAREIGSYGRALYAAPSYLAAHGTPQHPDELARHRLIGNSASPFLNRWPLAAGGPGEVLQVQGHTRSDNSAVIMALARQGVGIARLGDLLARPYVERGELMPVLQGHFADTRVPMYAVMLQERHRLPKIRACIDYWAEWLRALEVGTPA
jgi:DNA-binding transcriptional LysR family regulator